MFLWDPSSATSSNMIERIQRKLSCSVEFVNNIPYSLHDATSVRLAVALDTHCQ